MGKQIWDGFWDLMCNVDSQWACCYRFSEGNLALLSFYVENSILILIPLASMLTSGTKGF